MVLACEAVVSMEFDSDKRDKESSLRERRYAIRYPFAAFSEMLELESGARVSGVTSDLSPGGCFVCARRPLKIGARVRGTLMHNGQKIEMLAGGSFTKLSAMLAPDFQAFGTLRVAFDVSVQTAVSTENWLFIVLLPRRCVHSVCQLR